MMDESKSLQNCPAEGLIPREDNAIKHVLDVLAPYSTKNGGPLEVEHVVFSEGRGNVLLKYPGSTDHVTAIVGSHLDVVPADPEVWDVDPFKMTVKGDKLYGRGTTDCLGHVAVVTDLFCHLAETKPKLATNVVAVFIASEEALSEKGVGIDGLMEAGRLDALKNGTVLWLDSADSQPCMGTAGALQWHLKATGKLFHSGLPHLAINPIELAMDTLTYIQKRFYMSYPPHPEEKRYKFTTCSTFKPTQVASAKGSLNQIPPHCTISGDIRVTPFYDCKQIIKDVTSYVAEAQKSLHMLPNNRGPCSKYTLPDQIGKVTIDFGDNPPLRGIACNIDSPGFKSLCDAMEEVKGEVKPYSITGSLPLVQDLKEAGYDVQITGFGLSSVYHGINEYVLLSDIKNGLRILASFVRRLDKVARAKK